jgi:glyoxylate carboligase
MLASLIATAGRARAGRSRGEGDPLGAEAVLIAGNGVRIAQAYDQLRRLVEAVGLPVATTAAGKGCFAETHPLGLRV